MTNVCKLFPSAFDKTYSEIVDNFKELNNYKVLLDEKFLSSKKYIYP